MRPQDPTPHATVASPLDESALARLDAGVATPTPFPHLPIDGLLTPSAFEALRTFPPIERFARHAGIARHHGQRPHDRYYLALDESRYDVYRDDDHEQGVIGRGELPEAWRAFVDALETNPVYRSLVADLMGSDELRWRYAWHLGHAGSEVSPHKDDPAKAGTHLLYFNTADDWDPAWGGDTLLLHGPTTSRENPDFDDFAACEPVASLGNRSLLFANRPDAWHGVRALDCPTDRHRKLFTVVFEHEYPAPDAPPPRRGRGLLDRFRRR